MNRIIKSTIFLLAILISVSVFSQDKEDRSLDSFNKMRVGEGIRVQLIKGSAEKAVLEVRGLDLEDVVTEVRGGNLTIYLSGNHYRNTDVFIELTYKTLNSITISSAANVRTQEAITSDDLYISVSSAGSGELEVKVKELELEASSAGTMDVFGSATEVEGSASSAGSIDAYDLNAEEVTVRASSAGSLKVNASRLIDARASSGGSIRYRGNPSKEYTNSSSGGSVRKTG